MISCSIVLESILNFVFSTMFCTSKHDDVIGSYYELVGFEPQ